MDTLYGKNELLPKNLKQNPMIQNGTIINLTEIRNFYKNKCKEEENKFQEKDFKNFVKFLEIDFYDWLKGNLKYFER